MLRFGIVLASECRADRSLSEQLQERIQLTRLAKEAGFDEVWLGHSYASPVPRLHNLLTLAYMAGIVGGVTIGAQVALPVAHPVTLAEELATLDILTGGHSKILVFMGSRQEESAAFQVPIQERVSYFTEVLNAMRSLWSGEEVNLIGRHFQLRGVRVGVRPVQKPHPPILAGGSSKGAAMRAARLGFPFLNSAKTPWPDVVRFLEVYRQTVADLRQPAPNEQPILRHVVVDRIQEGARARAREFFPSSQTTSMVHLAVIGDPSESAEQIKAHCEAARATSFIASFRGPGLTHQLEMESVRMFGEHIIPRLRP